LSLGRLEYNDRCDGDSVWHAKQPTIWRLRLQMIIRWVEGWSGGNVSGFFRLYWYFIILEGGGTYFDKKFIILITLQWYGIVDRAVCEVVFAATVSLSVDRRYNIVINRRIRRVRNNNLCKSLVKFDRMDIAGILSSRPTQRAFGSRR